MTVTPAVVEEEAPKKGLSFKFPPEETEMGIIAGIIAVLIVIFPGLPAVVKAIGVIFALAWGADSVRKTSKYGLGTGVPSIGVLGMGYGIIGAWIGIAIVSKVGYAVGALGGVLLMGVIGYISGIFSNNEKFIGMKIPRLERGMMELGMAGTLAMLLQFSIVAGSLSFDVVVDKAINTGLIALMFIFSCLAMFHPYNACLGPDERRERTRMVSVEISGLLCLILGIVLATTDIVGGVSLIVFGAVVWIVFYVKFVRAAMREAYSVVGTGLIKTIG